jgi:hypothetical protein
MVTIDSLKRHLAGGAGCGLLNRLRGAIAPILADCRQDNADRQMVCQLPRFAHVARRATRDDADHDSNPFLGSGTNA